VQGICHRSYLRRSKRRRG